MVANTATVFFGSSPSLECRPMFGVQWLVEVFWTALTYLALIFAMLVSKIWPTSTGDMVFRNKNKFRPGSFKEISLKIHRNFIEISLNFH